MVLSLNLNQAGSLTYDERCCEITISRQVRGRHAAVRSGRLLCEWDWWGRNAGRFPPPSCLQCRASLPLWWGDLSWTCFKPKVL